MAASARICCRGMLVLGFCVLAGACWRSGHVSRKGCSISGRVNRQGSQDPVGGALVIARLVAPSSHRNLRYTGTTTPAGEFLLQDLEPGVYDLEVRRAGMLLVRSGSRSTRFNTQDHPDIRWLRFEMCPGRVLSGTVRSEDGRPTAGASVEALRVSYLGSVPRFVGAGRTMTDDTGRYVVEVPAAASYVLFAQPKQNMDSRGRTDITTFYPHAPNPSAAVSVAADSSDPGGGLDIKLRKARPGCVRIRIAGSLSAGRSDQEAVQPLIGLNLRSVAFDRESAFRFPPVPAGPDTFEFRNLPPGSYVAYAIVPSKQLRAAYAAISLPEAQSAERTLEMEAGLDIGGHASGVTAGELRAARVSLTPIDSPAAGMLSSGVDDSGNFTLSGIAPGHYAVSVAGLPPGVAVRSVSFGGRESPSGEIDIRAAGYLSLDLMKSALTALAPGSADGR